MVVFSCGHCGEALKKAQVEKHYQTKCRSCNVLSCIDCGKDFWGSEYEQHTKCISEEEKYSGKNYVPKPNANKGEVKQQQWLEQVQAAIDKVKANPQLKNVLERMKEYPNIPRKKAKFENFLKNSLRVYNQKLASQVWDLIMANTDKPLNGVAVESTAEDQSAQLVQAASQNTESSSENHSNGSEDVKKLNKRERKEERRKQSQKVEKKHKHANEVQNDCETQLTNDRKRKKKKRKHEDEEDIESPLKRKKSEQSGQENGVISTDLDETVDNEPEEDGPAKKRYKTKFNWAEVIQAVLKKKGEISIKKLRKKVLAEYLAQGCTEKSEEKLWAKFEKKLKKNPTFKILKDRVKLVT